ncbi:MAG: DUF58 domain-containing protein [Myxococcales bacterium]|nr:DUF58 domain-containing protein [Myxococcales bacterium]
MLSRDILRKIRKIELSASRLVSEQLAGRYHSVFKGRGMAFSEVREYLPGDDVRSIDWNVSARMSRAHIKLFTEERDRTVMLLVDMSASGLFGSQEQSKREVAAEMAAMVAFSAIANDDRVGLIVFTDKVELYLPPKKGKKHVLRVIREVLSYEPESRKTDVGVGLEYLSRVIKRRCVGFLISDLLATDWERPVRMAARRHDLVPIIISDPLESALPNLGLLVVQDIESGVLLEFDTGGPEAKEYRRRVAASTAERAVVLRRLKLDFVEVQTNESHVDALVHFFRRRERRMIHT